ncbi:MAG: hypothetical protein ACI85I_002477, partial [Arenicella sp.]
TKNRPKRNKYNGVSYLIPFTYIFWANKFVSRRIS